MAWHAVESLTLGRRDECKLTQVGHGRGRGAGRVECRGERLARSVGVMWWPLQCVTEGANASGAPSTHPT